MRYVSIMNQMIPGRALLSYLDRALERARPLARSPLTAPSVGTVATWHGRYVI